MEVLEIQDYSVAGFCFSNYQDYVNFIIRYDIQKKFNFSKNKKYNHLVGCSIHLKSINGIYEVTTSDIDGLVVTCNKWKIDFERGNRNYSHRLIDFSDFKCLVGLSVRKQKNSAVGAND
jgi:hypothetical protein